MKHSLYLKFLLGYLVFGLLGILCITTFSSDLAYQYLIKEKAAALYDEANILSQNYNNLYKGNSTISQLPADPHLKAISAYLGSRILVLNRQGCIMMDTNDSAYTGQIVESFDPAGFGSHYYQIGSYYGLFSEKHLSVMAPITGNFRTYGYVTIHLPVSTVLAAREQIMNIVYATAAVIYILSLLILLIFTATVYLPLKKITHAATKFADGDLTYKLHLNADDEMGYLASILNFMSDELSEIEEYQKKFISNVSHDFRSPLTSIKGYVEAMLDGTIPPEMQERYLNIVIAETERLNKLTQSMLYLNDLGSKSTYLVKTRFDLHRIINDTAASFEGTCSKRNMILDITYSSQVQMIYADMEKIQRVFYNLIDNAIKFSEDNSVIYIETSVKNDKVYVSIKDTGTGIPTEHLKRIWERFYKSDSSRGKDKRGTGLGLAIVKEIIQAHGETIDVISTEGVGTEFRFTLTKNESR